MKYDKRFIDFLAVFGTNYGWHGLVDSDDDMVYLQYWFSGLHKTDVIIPQDPGSMPHSEKQDHVNGYIPFEKKLFDDTELVKRLQIAQVGLLKKQKRRVHHISDKPPPPDKCSFLPRYAGEVVLQEEGKLTRR